MLEKIYFKLNKLIIFSIFLSITFSIFIGLYIVFFSTIGKDVTWTSMVPLNFLLLNIIGIYNIQYILGTIFALFLVFYTASYLIGIWRPIFLFNNLSDKFLIKHSFDPNSSSLNYLYIVIQWFSSYFLLSLVIDTIQQFFGIQIGNPLMGNPLLSFLYLSAAPLNE